MNNIRKFENMINLIRQIPEEEPPRGLVDNVCGSLQPKRLPTWKKIYRAIMTPYEISFTPAKLIPVAAGCVFLFFVVFTNNNNELQIETQKNGLNLVPITFSLDQTSASSVYVVGSFNDWDPKLHKMTIDPVSKTWVVKIMLPAGQHEYAFLVDEDRVMPDPKASIKRQDGFGSYNSVLFTNPKNETFL